jgi:hypothetical protein
MLVKALTHWLSDIRNFSDLVLEKPLRQYQLQPTDAILKSILNGEGETYAVMMSRQAGKNELSAQLEAYLLNLYQRVGGNIVKGSPTFKPQTINSIIRLQDRMRNEWNKGRFRRREGFIIELGKARTYFFSADPAANVVGATADVLLEADEAQEIDQTKWDKDFTPMGASTNVTTVFYGTAWTTNTFLASIIRFLNEKTRWDNVKRVFEIPCDVVAAEVPAYGEFVKNQVRRLGRDHPLVKTQFYLETIDGAGGLFPEKRRRMMRGNHDRAVTPTAGHRYALLIDVAGEDENAGDALERMMLENPKRDATAITIVDVLIDRTLEPVQRVYRVMDRQLFLGTSFPSLRAEILKIARYWSCQWVVVDATGIGAGLVSFMTNALGDKLIPIVFTPKIKSDMGWGFVGIVETGRYMDYKEDGMQDTRQFWYEVEACQYEIREGPQKSMRWGVYESPGYDGLVARGHDDLLVSAGMCYFLEEQDYFGDAIGVPVDTDDVLDSIDSADW